MFSIETILFHTTWPDYQVIKHGIVSFRGELVHEGTTMNSYTVETNKYLQLFDYQQQNHEITRWKWKCTKLFHSALVQIHAYAPVYILMYILNTTICKSQFTLNIKKKFPSCYPPLWYSLPAPRIIHNNNSNKNKHKK